MVKILGLVILVYGVAGVIGSYLVYRALQSPIARLRAQLEALAAKLAGARNQLQGVAEALAEQIQPALQQLVKQLQVIAAGVGITSAVFGEHRDQLAGIADWLRSWTVLLPTATPLSKPLNLDLSLTLPEVTSTEYGVGDLTLYGPPPIVTSKEYTLLDLGTVNVVTALDIQPRAPLEPVAGLFDLAAGKVNGVCDQLNGTRDQIIGAGTFVSDQARATGDAATQINRMVVDLENGQEALTNLSHSRWLHLGPTAVIGYFGLMHLAFALTGLALLLV